MLNFKGIKFWDSGGVKNIKMDKEQILYEDKDIIVCHKPAGIATQTAKIGQHDMVSEVANYLAAEYRTSVKSGKHPYVGLIHRLDQPVEGILVFAKNQAAAGELGKQVSDGRMEKYYYAVVVIDGVAAEPETDDEIASEKTGEIPKNQDRNDRSVEVTKVSNKERLGAKIEEKSDLGIISIKDEKTLIDYLCKDNGLNISMIVDREYSGAKRAELHYKLFSRMPVKAFYEKYIHAEYDDIKYTNTAYTKTENSMPLLADYENTDIALARIKLITGRHHQIRVQMSNAGMSLLGDYKYADDKTVKISELLDQKQVALCAYELAFNHPVTGKRLSFHKDPEAKIFQIFSL